MWLAPKHVQPGTVVVAGALLLAALERLCCRSAGRACSSPVRRLPDVMALTALGAGILAVALVLPAHPEQVARIHLDVAIPAA